MRKRYACWSPARACAPWNANPYASDNAGRLRGGRQGATAPPAPPARGAAPGNPDLMRLRYEGQARMLMGRLAQVAAHAHFDITKPCTDGLIVRQAACAGGLGARCAPSGEREGR